METNGVSPPWFGPLLADPGQGPQQVLLIEGEGAPDKSFSSPPISMILIGNEHSSPCVLTPLFPLCQMGSMLSSQLTCLNGSKYLRHVAFGIVAGLA